MGKFVFDKASGTMKENDSPEAVIQNAEEQEKAQEETKNNGMNIAELASQANVEEDENEPEVVFKLKSDFKTFYIEDMAVHKWLCYIAGYGLDIRFNVKEFRGHNATKKIEACLNGITSLFRKIIYEQALDVDIEDPSAAKQTK